MAIISRSFTYLSRRRFIQGVAGSSAAILTSGIPNLAHASDMIPFLKASSLLCGIELDRSYIQLGERIYRALTHGARPQDLKYWQRLINVLAKLPIKTTEKHLHQKLKSMGPHYLEKARLLARVWYTGRIERTTGPGITTFEVITYDEALVWQACTFTKPPVTCGGHFGYWQHPYSGTGDV
ncbi:MAG: sugar dehydrogenase complex small subunit [Terasakiella sp.]|uniref:sugar dehydrogenase complex small subunit n=1 Tax=unclassified Terasakiella TaxID=2614952 RepID=UPI003B00E3A2